MQRVAKPRTGGAPIARFLRIAVSGTLLLAGCRSVLGYSFSGGGGLASNVKTVAILPFDNETSSSDLQRELTDALREALEKRLGLRTATEEKADAIVRGKITRYDLDIPVAISADRSQVATGRRRLAIAVDIEFVVQSDGKPLWKRSGLVAEGEYAERGEANGRKQAIDRIVADVIEGAQSQW
ncbi:MAG TPA: LptE family protein [Gemmatimonadaceae bacterium]|nr:LptE family protein [Gemmatimonadaceae bacterium]